MNNKFLSPITCLIVGFFLLVISTISAQSIKSDHPNIVLIYTDDVGYGDVGCYGAHSITTPNIDRLAREGIRFTNAHATSATCTPSRFSLLTGRYAWRKQGTGVAPGNASLIIPTDKGTLPGMLQTAGYTTAVIGKWHLGLGGETGPDWNGDIKPGPLEIGFNYSFIIPATGDRVPCVYVENHRVVNLDANDPIVVSYKEPVNPDDPTGKRNPELLKMHPSHGHDMSIVNGVSRIGYMSGGQSARWKDEDMADVITQKAVRFIEENKNNRFFLYFSTHDIHVPRIPHPRFEGKSGMGPRGDAIVQLDWSVGTLVETLAKNNLLENTLIIFTSDNGPVVDDGYRDDAVEKLGNHKPAGQWRGGKYSAFEAGTRIPFIVSWKGHLKEGKVSNALFSQIDLYASLASLTGQEIKEGDAPDSKNSISSLFFKSQKSREWLVEQSVSSTLSIIQNNWKYIEPSSGPKYIKETNTELGNDPQPQLYDLKNDPGEKNNLATKFPEKMNVMEKLLQSVKEHP
jgi:arylsulfatase A-like enzyme